MRMRILSAIHAWANGRTHEPAPPQPDTVGDEAPVCAPSYEFSFPMKDTLILVENHADEVIVRATRDTFTEAQKASFIERLGAEGFIPSTCHWGQPLGYQGHDEPDVRWVIDYSWLKLTEEILAPSRRFMIRLFAGAAVLWLILLVGLFVHATR